jgi:hypothetical protein
MKKIMIFFLGASLFLVNISAYAQTTYYTTAGIPESSTLTLRAWPSHVSQPIANIPHNTSEIMPTGKNILLNEDNWLQVAFENKVGWVEAVYVAELPVTSTPIAQAEPIEKVEKEAAFAMPEVVTATTASAPEPVIPTQTYAPQDAEPTTDAIPWSASADSIYQDPHANTNVQQQSEVITTTHSVIVIPTTAEDIDLRNVDVNHSRYSSIDTSMSLQYENN